MESAPCDPENPLDSAERLMAEGRAGEAFRILEALIAENRGGVLARLLCARALTVAGRRDRALNG